MDARTKPMFSMFLMLSGVILTVILYYYAYPFWVRVGVSSDMTNTLMIQIYRSGVMSSQMAVRGLCLFFCLLSFIVRSGNSKDSSWAEILLPLLSGLAVFMASPFLGNRVMYLVATFTGYVMFMAGAVLLGRKFRSFNANLPDYWDTFEQCEDLIENDLSVNIPFRYQCKGKIRNGYANVVSPQRATLILGIPGSGKTAAIYRHYIRQMLSKGYAMFVYDYKYPDLTRIVMNELLDNYSCFKVKPKFYAVNFDDPLYSHRFNPIHPRYLTDPIDSTEVAEIIMSNVSRGKEKKEDFFSTSAVCYIDLLIWFLKIYEDGKYCTFPHLIELMGQDYRDVFEILKKFDELEVKRNTFADAIKDKAFEQLQGQIASARVPLNRFASKTLYWTLSGDDFSLDINNPEEPKIICVGNNPLRQSIYGTTLALLTSRLFKMINRPGRLHSAVLIDELPTILLKGLDQLINTSRSNNVATVLGAQDKTQLVKDYDKKESDVIFNTVGNLFAGAVKGSTAETLSKSFGKEEREARSYQESDTSDHVTYSYQLRDVLPAHKIESLSQGTFCGYVADTFKQKVNPKIFCGEVILPPPAQHNEDIPKILNLPEDKIEEEITNNYLRIKREIVNLIRDELSKAKG